VRRGRGAAGVVQAGAGGVVSPVASLMPLPTANVAGAKSRDKLRERWEGAELGSPPVSWWNCQLLYAAPSMSVALIISRPNGVAPI
jgi:hypothetical protein